MDDKRILIVEDESIISLELKTQLEKLSYQVVGIVNTAERAIKQAEQLKPDLVLMDIVLKGDKDGIEAAEQIRRSAGTPVIFLTAHADELTLQRAKVSGPFGYLIKPFQMRDLQITIEVALYKHQIERKLRESEERMRLLIESTDDVVLVQNLEGIYQYAHVSSRYGITANDVLGKTPGDFFTPDFANEMELHHARILETGTSTTTEVELDWLGEHLWFNVHMYPLRNATGQINAVATIARNITETKRLKGMLPICAWCGKRILGDDGQWEPLDHYIIKHTSAKVTHSICNNCLDHELHSMGKR